MACWHGFNPRAHAGRDSKTLQRESAREFQSTRPRGARRCVGLDGVETCCFNPRAHAGRDRDSSLGNISAIVSIHAPTRGATFCLPRLGFIGFVSIHAPTRGATQPAFDECAGTFVSIHAPTRGATCGMVWFPMPPSFNPRAHAGRDYDVSAVSRPANVSIHAPARGATRRSFYSVA